ncbi:MAG: hypothetical protein AB4372_38465 [Xenococcus sp. (in: cyanobacteria)]
MQKLLTEWGHYIIVAIIPGIVNIIFAGQELNQKCRFLPFFKPHKSLGFWIWLLLQFIAPILLFWWFASINSKPTIDLILISKAIGLGVGFVAIFNATVEVGNLSLEIKSFYNSLVDIAYRSIADKQTRRTAEFWDDVEQELSKSNINLFSGLNYLEYYFSCDSFLHQNPQKLQEKIDKLNQIGNITQQAEQVKEITNLLMFNVRRNDLPKVLAKFSCSQQLIDTYFT